MQNSKKKTVAVFGISVAVLATQAMTQVGTEVYNIDREKIPEETMRRMNAVLSQYDSKIAVSNALALVAQKIGQDDVSLANKYFPQGHPQLAQTIKADDFTIGGAATTANPGSVAPQASGCYSNCYSNCHSACHSACYSECHNTAQDH